MNNPSLVLIRGKGLEALDWDTSEAASWLRVEGLDRWKRQLVSVLRDGHALLTTLNEGVLQRVGVPKRKAKEVMQLGRATPGAVRDHFGSNRMTTSTKNTK